MNFAQYIKGVQHIGIPTADMDASKSFYEALGFETIFSCLNGDSRVCFFGRNGVVFEVYESGEAVGAKGAIDHISIDVSDIEAVYREVCEAGFRIVSCGIEQLPFFQNGVRFFIIEGPNAERVEFNQYL